MRLGRRFTRKFSNVHVETIVLFIDADANTNLEDAQGRTPDQLAKECHQPAILEKLGKLPSSSLALPPFMPSPGSTESGSLFLERTIRIYERITVFFISLVFFCVYQSRKMYRP